MRSWNWIQWATSGLLLIAVHSPASAKSSTAAAGFSSAVCEREVENKDADAIMREVFEEKFQRLVVEKPESLAASGVTSKEFVKRNAGLKYAICDSRGSFDSLSVDKVGVAFDIKLLVLLMAQARAIIMGATVNRSDQFGLHRRLMSEFIVGGSRKSINPIQQVEHDALASGMKTSDYSALLTNVDFLRRERTLFLVSLYFLSMHERCHFALGHHAKIDKIKKLPEASQRVPRRQLEMDADRCAIAIVNFDEGGFASSPISYFGAIAIVTTQAIVSSFDSSPDTSSHPSSRARLGQAQKNVLEFVEASRSLDEARYAKFKATIDAASIHMGSMFDIADEARRLRLGGR